VSKIPEIIPEPGQIEVRLNFQSISQFFKKTYQISGTPEPVPYYTETTRYYLFFSILLELSFKDCLTSSD